MSPEAFEKLIREDYEDMAKVVKAVGNYGEIYDRNLGPDTPFNLARGQTDIWTTGGLMSAPPIR